MNKKIKGMVMALDAQEALILTPDGQFLRVKKPADTCVVGMEILCEVPDENAKKTLSLGRVLKTAADNLVPRRPLLQGVLAAAMVLSLGVGSWAYPAGKLYMEVNPSVGLTYNVYHRIIGTESFNADGAQVIQGLAIYGKPLAEGVTDTFKAIDEKGFLKNGEDEVSDVVLGYTDAVVADEAAEAISQVVESVQKPVNLASVSVKPKVLKQATPEQTPVNAAIQQQKEPPKTLKNDRVEKVKQNVAAKKAEKKRLEAEQEKKRNEAEPAKQPAKPEKIEKPKVNIKPEKPQPVEKDKLRAERRQLEKLIEALIAERDGILNGELGTKEKDKQLKRIDKKIEQLEKRLKKILELQESNVTGS